MGSGRGSVRRPSPSPDRGLLQATRSCERARACGRQWSCAPRDGHSLLSIRTCLCRKTEGGDMVLLRAHRLRPPRTWGTPGRSAPCRAEARRPVFRWGKLLVPLMLWELASRQPAEAGPRSPGRPSGSLRQTCSSSPAPESPPHPGPPWEPARLGAVGAGQALSRAMVLQVERRAPSRSACCACGRRSPLCVACCAGRNAEPLSSARVLCPWKCGPLSQRTRAVREWKSLSPVAAGPTSPSIS